MENAGNLRSGNVKIGGTQWKPSLPNQEKFQSALDNIKQIENPTERAIEIMAYTMKSQLFWDGNKRSAMLLANHEMIKNGVGVITIPIDRKEKFGEELIKYYEIDDIKDLKQFIYDYCVPTGSGFFWGQLTKRNSPFSHILLGSGSSPQKNPEPVGTQNQNKRKYE